MERLILSLIQSCLKSKLSFKISQGLTCVLKQALNNGDDDGGDVDDNSCCLWSNDGEKLKLRGTK